MRTELLPHPCSGRVRDGRATDSERELKSLKIPLKIPLKLQKTLHLQAFFMEARVGIAKLDSVYCVLYPEFAGKIQ
jgi:hypothetical protein